MTRAHIHRTAVSVQVLKAAGLRCVIDTDVFRTAAQHLSDRFHFASGQAAAEQEVFAVAEDLMRWLKSNIFDLSISGPFYRAVQNISFVPATQVRRIGNFWPDAGFSRCSEVLLWFQAVVQLL